MAGKLKLLVCCGSGAGASVTIRLNVEKVIKKMGLGIQEIRHCAVSERKSAIGQYDIILCSKNFANMFADAEKRDTKIIGLKSVTPAKRIEEGPIATTNK